MTWYPIAFFPPQFENSSGEPYSGAVLKAYAAGTTTPISMATTYTGGTLVGSVSLNASGYPTYNSSVIIPHVSENYKLALYPTQAAADANSGALWTYDDIQIAESTNDPFVEYFDGDGSDTTFTLSEDLGNDEETLMVFADRPLLDYVTNGTFASDTAWTKGAGWTIGAGVATATGAISTAISQTAGSPVIQGQSYTVEFTITVSAGTLTPSIGGNSGTARSGSGTYRETIIAGSTQTLAFTGAGFTGTLDTITVKPVQAARRELIRPDEYTLVGNQLTLTFAPPTGTKNIIVFAPSQLLGAANNAAAAAATSETNAAASASAASASASAASSSASAAAASYDSFDDRYLGAKSSDPTLDNDGNALLDGALYWNTTAKQLRIYDLGTLTWVAAVVNPSGGPFLPLSGGTMGGVLALAANSTAPKAADGTNSTVLASTSFVREMGMALNAAGMVTGVTVDTVLTDSQTWGKVIQFGSGTSRTATFPSLTASTHNSRIVTFWNNTAVNHTIATSGADRMYWGINENVSSLVIRPYERVTFAKYGTLMIALDNRPGAQVYTTNVYYATNTALATNIPHDDTIPTSSEGDQIMTLAYTAKDASSTLWIDVFITGGHGTSGQTLTAHLLVSTSTLQAGCRSNLANGTVTNFSFRQVRTAGSTSSQTFNVRAGTSSGSAYMNGDSSGRKYGGAMACLMTITEFTPAYGG